MCDVLKKLCDDMIRYNRIKADKEIEVGNKILRIFLIESEGEEWILFKCNGEWIFCYHLDI